MPAQLLAACLCTASLLTPLDLSQVLQVAQAGGEWVARMRRQPSATAVAANRPKPCTPLLQARPEHLCKAAELLERGRVC